MSSCEIDFFTRRDEAKEVSQRMAVKHQIPLQSPFAYLQFFASSCERHFSHQAVESLKVHKNGGDALTILTIAFVYLRSFVPSCERHFSHQAVVSLKVHKNGCDALTILTIAFVYLRSFVPSCERHFHTKSWKA